MGEILSSSINLRQGSLDIEADFSLTAPWTCLFGPSGSGKSTILHAIAGLIRPRQGRIVLVGDGGVLRRPEQVLFDSAVSTFLPPHLRAVRVCAQQAWLFPGTVRSNIGYGVTVPEIEGCVRSVADRLRLLPLIDADVRSLSGGERQRVSLARAVAAALYSDRRVDLLLLDEPFSGMDVGMRDVLALDLCEWLMDQHMPVLSVTHDVGEAFLLEAEIIRISEGRIVAQGTVDDVLAEERRTLRALLG